MANVINKSFDRGSGFHTCDVDTLIPSGSYIDFPLPEGNKNAAVTTVLDASGVQLVPGAATFTAKVVDKVFVDHNTKIIPGYVRVTAGTGGIAVGSCIIVHFVA